MGSETIRISGSAVDESPTRGEDFLQDTDTPTGGVVTETQIDSAA